MSGFTILIVDDEPQLRKLLRSILEQNSYKILDAGTLKEAETLAHSHRPHMILLDLNLPDGSGMDFIPKLREWYQEPIMVVSVHEQPETIVQALEKGADDYIQKPFESSLLLARVKVALRRRHREEHSGEVLKNKNLSINFDTRLVKIFDREIKLTATEYDLLAFFMKNPGKVLTGPSIVKAVWGTSFEQNSKNLRVYVRFLRQKFEKEDSDTEYIITEQGIGYRFIHP